MRLRLVLPLLALLGSLPFVVGQNPYYLHIMIMVMVNIVMAATLRLEYRAGVFQFGHAAYLAIGAYASALLATKFGVSPWLGTVAAGILAIAVATGIGAVTLRLKYLYFALASVAFVELVRLVLLNWTNLTGGAGGIIRIPPFSVGGFEFASRLPFYYLILLIAIICLVFLWRLEKSRYGLTWQMLEHNEKLSLSVGIPPARYKMAALVIGSFFAGIVGSFTAHYTGFIAPSIASLWISFYYLVYCVVGGLGSISGPVLGTMILAGLPYFLSSLREYETIIMGVVMLAIVFTRPEGFVSFGPLISSLFDNLLKKRRRGAKP